LTKENPDIPRLAVLVGRGGARKGGTSHPSGELRLDSASTTKLLGAVKAMADKISAGPMVAVEVELKFS